MPTVEATVEIAQSPAVIAEAFLDPNNHVYYTTDLERLEVIKRQPGEVGSVAHLHYRQKGRGYVLEDELLEMIPNRYFRSRITGGGLVAEVQTWIQALNGSSQVTLRWSGTGTTVLTRLLLPFMKGQIRRGATKELLKFKALVERHGAHFSDERLVE